VARRSLSPLADPNCVTVGVDNRAARSGVRRHLHAGGGRCAGSRPAQTRLAARSGCRSGARAGSCPRVAARAATRPAKSCRRAARRVRHLGAMRHQRQPPAQGRFAERHAQVEGQRPRRGGTASTCAPAKRWKIGPMSASLSSASSTSAGSRRCITATSARDRCGSGVPGSWITPIRLAWGSASRSSPTRGRASPRRQRRL
jgi:hypothetical protein